MLNEDLSKYFLEIFMIRAVAYIQMTHPFRDYTSQSIKAWWGGNMQVLISNQERM